MPAGDSRRRVVEDQRPGRASGNAPRHLARGRCRVIPEPDLSPGMHLPGIESAAGEAGSVGSQVAFSLPADPLAQDGRRNLQSAHP
jgi:hypothetical protein